MDIKTVFKTHPISVNQSLSECQKASADREQPQGSFYAPYRKNKEKYEPQQDVDGKKEKNVRDKLNENELNVSNVLESIELQRSLNEKIK